MSQAIGLTAFGGPEVLHVVDVATPAPGPGEIAIDVRAAAVNPTDLTFRAGGRVKQLAAFAPPWIPGVDLAGVVAELGPDADGRFVVGDRVAAVVVPMTARGGSYARRVVVDQRSVVAAPRGSSHAAASTLLLNALTAALALDSAAGDADTVVVTGAAGALGGFVVQLAAAAGKRVVAVAGPAVRRLVASWGAAEFVTRDDDLGTRLRAVEPGGATLVVDAANLDAAALPAVADGGTLVTVKGWAGPADRGIRVRPVSAFGAFTDVEALERVRLLADDGVLRLRVAEVLPARDAAAAHRRLAGGGTRGRLVLDIGALAE